MTNGYGTTGQKVKHFLAVQCSMASTAREEDGEKGAVAAEKITALERSNHICKLFELLASWQE